MSIKGIDGETIMSTGSKAMPFEVLHSDYEDYSIMWSCSHRWGLGKIEKLWVVTREKFQTDEQSNHHRWTFKSLEILNILAALFPKHYFGNNFERL